MQDFTNLKVNVAFDVAAGYQDALQRAEEGRMRRGDIEKLAELRGLLNAKTLRLEQVEDFRRGFVKGKLAIVD